MANKQYTFRIALDGSRPEIWRTFSVDGLVSLKRLHEVIQLVMGWNNYHLHDFIIRDVRYTSFEYESWGEGDERDETEYRVQKLGLTAGDTFRYVYDYGDNWKHTLTVLDITKTEAYTHPMCLDGAQACPLEDSGGMHGYYEKILVWKHPDPNDEWHQEILGWLPKDFNPDYFSVDEANRYLEMLSVKRKRLSTIARMMFDKRWS